VALLALALALPICGTGTTSSMRIRWGMTGDLARKTLSGVTDAEVEEVLLERDL